MQDMPADMFWGRIKTRMAATQVLCLVTSHSHTHAHTFHTPKLLLSTTAILLLHSVSTGGIVCICKPK